MKLSRRDELDKQLRELTERELDKLLFSLSQTVEKKIVANVLHVDTDRLPKEKEKNFLSYSTLAGKAYKRWAGKIANQYTELPRIEEMFLLSIASENKLLTKDTVTELKYYFNKYPIEHTTGDKKKDEKIWAYIYGRRQV